LPTARPLLGLQALIGGEPTWPSFRLKKMLFTLGTFFSAPSERHSSFTAGSPFMTPDEESCGIARPPPPPPHPFRAFLKQLSLASRRLHFPLSRSLIDSRFSDDYSPQAQGGFFAFPPQEPPFVFLSITLICRIQD